MDDLFEQLAKITKVLYHSHELPSIWIDKPLQTATERTVRIHAGHMVRLHDEALIDCTDNNPATHEIVSIRGSAHPPFKITLRSLENEETKTITI